MGVSWGRHLKLLHGMDFPYTLKSVIPFRSVMLFRGGAAQKSQQRVGRD